MSQVQDKREPVRFLVFSASLQADSLNSRLTALAADTIEANGGQVDRASMTDFDTPSFDADLLATRGQPHGAKEFRRRLQRGDAFVISAPEYNHSMPGALKNSIDWVSRFDPQPFNARHGLLLAASPSLVGGNRGLMALRIPLEALGARVYPDMFSMARASEAFDASGRIADEALQQRFDSNVISFMDLVEASTHYPRVKKVWAQIPDHTDNVVV
jgi:NAD(P)H-dependent FMN reductase